MHKRSTKLDKTLRHFNYCLKNKWTIGEKIDSVSKISRRINTSYPTVKKVVQLLVRRGILDDQGASGIWVIGKNKSSDRADISLVQGNIKAAIFLNNGALFDRASMSLALRSSDHVTMYLPITDTKEVLRIEDILDIINLKNIVLLEDAMRNKALVSKYKRQTAVFNHLPCLLRHKTKLDLKIQ